MRNLTIGSLQINGQTRSEQFVDFKLGGDTQLQIVKPIQASASSSGAGGTGGIQAYNATPGNTGSLATTGLNIFDRGNDEHTITFGIWRSHLDGNGNADPDTAELFLVSHRAAVRAVGVATLTYTTAAGTYYFIPAFVKITNSFTMGCASFFNYQIIAGRISDEPGGSSGGGGGIGITAN